MVVVVGGRGGDRWYRYTVTTRMINQSTFYFMSVHIEAILDNDLCIKVGSDESHFNVS